MVKGVYKRSKSEIKRLSNQLKNGRLNNPDWRKKANETRKRLFREGKLVAWNKGKKNPALTLRNILNNPMKNPEIVKRIDYKERGIKISRAKMRHIVTEETKKKLRTGKYLLCDYCKKEIYIQKYLLKKDKKHYCSKKCADFGNRKELIKLCEECGKKFKTIPSKNFRFCGYKCSAINREKKGRTKEHIEKLKIILDKNREKIKKCKRCKLCGRLIGKKKHKCPTEKERQKIAKCLHTKKAREKKRKTLKRLYKEGKLIPVWLGKKRDKKTKKKISETKKWLYSLGLHKYSAKKGTQLNTGRTHFKKGQYAGEKSWNWKGGITPNKKAVWSSLEYQNWRKKIYERDNYTCQLCKKKSMPKNSLIINAHHIKPIYKYPKLIFDLNNGITLCKSCHIKIHKLDNKKEYYKNNNDEKKNKN